MLVTILPFFLVANVLLDDLHQQSEWAMYGPECTYDVLVNMSLANIVQENDNFCSMIATELKCRPKGHDSLSCHFENSRIKRPDLEKDRCTNAQDFVSTRYKFVNEKPFEIRFNSRGIVNLVVHRTIPRWRLAMIKDIVSQLNVGFEMRESRHSFVMIENSAVGQCKVDVKIIRGDPDSAEDDDDDDSSEEKEDGADFVIGFASSSSEFTQPIEKRYRVEKLRDPKKCTQTTYFFGNHENYNRNGQIYMNMTKSVSHIKISKNNFVSYTIADGMMKVANNSRIMRPRQNLRLKLKRIDFARSPLPEIENPAATSILAFSDVAATIADMEDPIDLMSDLVIDHNK